MKKHPTLPMQAKRILFCLFIMICLAFGAALPKSGQAAERERNESCIAHIASFRTSAKAEQYAKELEGKGLKAWTRKMDIPEKGLYYRVYVGTFESRKSAVQTLQKLKDKKVISYFAVETAGTASGEGKTLPPKAETRPDTGAAVSKPSPQPPKIVPPVEAKSPAATGKPVPEPAPAAPPAAAPQSRPATAPVSPFDPKQDASFHYNQGIKYLVKEQYDQALQSFSNAIRIDAEFAEGYIKRGDTWYLKGDNEMAINDYNTAIALKPNYSESYLGRGLAYKNLGQVGKSEEDLRHACKLGSEEACTLLKVWHKMISPGR